MAVLRMYLLYCSLFGSSFCKGLHSSIALQTESVVSSLAFLGCLTTTMSGALIQRCPQAGDSTLMGPGLKCFMDLSDFFITSLLRWRVIPKCLVLSWGCLQPDRFFFFKHLMLHKCFYVFQAESQFTSAALPFTGDSGTLTWDNLDEISHML